MSETTDWEKVVQAEFLLALANVTIDQIEEPEKKAREGTDQEAVAAVNRLGRTIVEVTDGMMKDPDRLHEIVYGGSE